MPEFSDSTDETALKVAVSRFGVVSVAIDADYLMPAYSSGIYDGPCLSKREHLNHAVTIIYYT